MVSKGTHGDSDSDYVKHHDSAGVGGDSCGQWHATPTGSVKLTGGGYTGTQTLSGGSATFKHPGRLADDG